MPAAPDPTRSTPDSSKGSPSWSGPSRRTSGSAIQHAVSLDFNQFADVFDALGGMDMPFPVSVFDAKSGLNVQAATCVHLNGIQALEVVRARHLQYDSGTKSRYAEDWPQENQSDLAPISVTITNSSGCWGGRWPSRDWGIRSPISISSTR